MRLQVTGLIAALLCPVLAGAQSRYYPDDFQNHRPWLSVGFGAATLNSDAPAPAADRKAFTFSIDAGVRINPEWGLGLEFGVVAPTSGCGGHHCTPELPDFAPDFSRWFLVSEYRPGDNGMRVRASAGLSSMCYRYYKTHHPAWVDFLDAVISDGEYHDDDSRGRDDYWACKHLHAFGAAASIGYQWRLGADPSKSVGLQLRGEMANFAASDKAGTPAFNHRALMLQLELVLN